MLHDEYNYTIKYFFRNKDRTAQIKEITTLDGTYFWLRFNGQPPRYLQFINGEWEAKGKPSLPEGLMQALAEGIIAHKKAP